MLKRGHHSPAWRVPELRLPWRYLPLEGVVYGPSAEAGVQRLTHTGEGCSSRQMFLTKVRGFAAGGAGSDPCGAGEGPLRDPSARRPLLRNPGAPPQRQHCQGGDPPGQRDLQDLWAPRPKATGHISACLRCDAAVHASRECHLVSVLTTRYLLLAALSVQRHSFGATIVRSLAQATNFSALHQETL